MLLAGLPALDGGADLVGHAALAGSLGKLSTERTRPLRAPCALGEDCIAYARLVVLDDLGGDGMETIVEQRKPVRGHLVHARERTTA